MQNLVITLEKLKYFLRQPNQKQNPPLRVLTPKEVVDILWNDTKNKIGEPEAPKKEKTAYNPPEQKNDNTCVHM